MPSPLAEVIARLRHARDDLAPAELHAFAEAIREQVWQPLGQLSRSTTNVGLSDALGLLDATMHGFTDAADQFTMATEKITDYIIDVYGLVETAGPVASTRRPAPPPETVWVPRSELVPPPTLARTLDPAWARWEQDTLPLRPTGTEPQTGRVCFSDGSDLTLVSGPGDRELIAAARTQLANSGQFPRPIAGLPVAAAAHVETKTATLMRHKGITFATLVLNTSEVCDGIYGCRQAIPAILPRGCTLLVWTTEAASPRVFHGKANQ
ncbi:DddA-like double-stranded DNA deaminase toxin [Allokutzneria sp. NRRL B-24872]|uniref:DddA-like double-stranded DNA deaminase toxin n=1 Tax=Allokutzneria sp. NRRL B-24872 TaxID=1137961 RepID=UPI001178A3C0|nr:DddA-like double-stranded DNA deaminase toxin [Allokutzneria sp. NRRL B-24872]